MIVILDYGMGNVGSIANMFNKIGAQVRVSSKLDDIRSADKLVLPGVGSFDHGMKNLRERGFEEILKEKVIIEGIPILGVCLGMQLFSMCSEEGIEAGLGWIKAETIRFSFDSATCELKVPHMGWNTVDVAKRNPLISTDKEEQRYYFVHSYHVVCNEPNDVLATTHHGYEVTAAFSHNNIYGVQFHPEKSHRFGMLLMKNFVEL